MCILHSCVWSPRAPAPNAVAQGLDSDAPELLLPGGRALRGEWEESFGSCVFLDCAAPPRALPPGPAAAPGPGAAPGPDPAGLPQAEGPRYLCHTERVLRFRSPPAAAGAAQRQAAAAAPPAVAAGAAAPGAPATQPGRAPAPAQAVAASLRGAVHAAAAPAAGVQLGAATQGAPEGAGLAALADGAARVPGAPRPQRDDSAGGGSTAAQPLVAHMDGPGSPGRLGARAPVDAAEPMQASDTEMGCAEAECIDGVGAVPHTLAAAPGAGADRAGCQ